MDPKPRPNDEMYFNILRGMTRQQRLAKAVELSADSRRLFYAGLRRRLPHLSETELRRVAVEHMHPWLKSNS